MYCSNISRCEMVNPRHHSNYDWLAVTTAALWLVDIHVTSGIVRVRLRAHATYLVFMRNYYF